MFIYKDKKIIYRAFKNNSEDLTATYVIGKYQKYDESKFTNQFNTDIKPIQFDFYQGKITPEMADTRYFYHEAKNKCITFSLKNLKGNYRYHESPVYETSNKQRQDQTLYEVIHQSTPHDPEYFNSFTPVPNSAHHLYAVPNLNETNANNMYAVPDELPATLRPPLIESDNEYEEIPPPRPPRKVGLPTYDNDNPPPLPVKKSK
jgi:hypothetical protein